MNIAVWVILVFGIVISVTASNNQTNETARTQDGKKVFRQGFGFGIVSTAILVLIIIGLSSGNSSM